MSLLQESDSEKSPPCATNLDAVELEMDSLGSEDVKDVKVRPVAEKSTPTSGRVTSSDLGSELFSKYCSYCQNVNMLHS